MDELEVDVQLATTQLQIDVELASLPEMQLQFDVELSTVLNIGSTTPDLYYGGPEFLQ